MLVRSPRDIPFVDGHFRAGGRPPFKGLAPALVGLAARIFQGVGVVALVHDHDHHIRLGFAAGRRCGKGVPVSQEADHFAGMRLRQFARDGVCIAEGLAARIGPQRPARVTLAEVPGVVGGEAVGQVTGVVVEPRPGLFNGDAPYLGVGQANLAVLLPLPVDQREVLGMILEVFLRRNDV